MVRTRPKAKTTIPQGESTPSAPGAAILRPRRFNATYSNIPTDTKTIPKKRAASRPAALRPRQFTIVIPPNEAMTAGPPPRAAALRPRRSNAVYSNISTDTKTIPKKRSASRKPKTTKESTTSLKEEEESASEENLEKAKKMRKSRSMSTKPRGKSTPPLTSFKEEESATAPNTSVENLEKANKAKMKRSASRKTKEATDIKTSLKEEEESASEENLEKAKKMRKSRSRSRKPRGKTPSEGQGRVMEEQMDTIAATEERDSDSEADEENELRRSASDYVPFDMDTRCKKLMEILGRDEGRSTLSTQELIELQHELEMCLVNSSDHRRRAEAEIAFLECGVRPTVSNRDLKKRPKSIYTLRHVKKPVPDYDPLPIEHADDDIDDEDVGARFWKWAEETLEPIDDAFLREFKEMFIDPSTPKYQQKYYVDSPWEHKMQDSVGQSKEPSPKKRCEREKSPGETSDDEEMEVDDEGAKLTFGFASETLMKDLAEAGIKISKDGKLEKDGVELDEDAAELLRCQMELKALEPVLHETINTTWKKVVNDYAWNKTNEELNKADYELFELISKSYNEVPPRVPTADEWPALCEATRRRNEAARVHYGDAYKRKPNFFAENAPEENTF